VLSTGLLSRLRPPTLARMTTNNATPPNHHPMDKTYLVTWQTLVVVHDTGNPELDQAWAVLTARNTMRDLLADPAEGDNYLTVEAIGNAKPEKAHWQLDHALSAYDAFGVAVPSQSE